MMTSPFHVLCEFGAFSVTCGGFLEEEKLFLSFRKSKLLHLVRRETVEGIYRFNHEVTWSASDGRILLASTSDGRIWEVPLDSLRGDETEMLSVIRDVEDTWLVAREENVRCFVVTETFLLTLKHCEYTRCVSLYDRCKDTTKFNEKPRLQLHFPIEINDESPGSHVCDDVTNIRNSPFLCLVPVSQQSKLGMVCVDHHLVTSLCGADDSSTNAVILYGDNQGVVRCIAVSNAPTETATTDGDSDSDFDWGVQTDPPVICCIDQPTQSLHTAILPMHGTGCVTQTHNAVVIVGCLGRVMLITADEQNRLDFHEYNVDSPVTASCVVSYHWLLHTTETDAYVTSLVMTEEEKKMSTERVLLTPSMGREETVQQRAQIAYRFTLKSIPLSLTCVTWLCSVGGSASASCVALTHSGSLYQFEWPNDAAREPTKRQSAKSGERKLQEILASLRVTASDMQCIDSEKTKIDLGIRDMSISMNVLCDFLDIHRGVSNPETAPLKISIKPVTRDRGLPGCEIAINCYVHNTSSYDLPTGWFMVICILPRSHSSPSISSPSPSFSSSALSPMLTPLSIPTESHSFPLGNLKPSMFADFEVPLPEWTQNSLLPMDVKCLLHYDASQLLHNVSLMPVDTAELPACTVAVETAQFDILDFVRPHSRSAPPPAHLNTSKMKCDAKKLLCQLQQHKSIHDTRATSDQSAGVSSPSGQAIRVTTLLVSRLSPTLALLASNPTEAGPSALLLRLLERNPLCRDVTLRSFGKQTSVKLLTPLNVSLDLQAMFVEKARLGPSTTLGLVPKDVELMISSIGDETLASVRVAVISRFLVKYCENMLEKYNGICRNAVMCCFCAVVS